MATALKVFLFLNAALVLLLFRCWPTRNGVDITMKGFCLGMSLMSVVFVLLGATIN